VHGLDWHIESARTRISFAVQPIGNAGGDNDCAADEQRPPAQQQKEKGSKLHRSSCQATLRQGKQYKTAPFGNIRIRSPVDGMCMVNRQGFSGAPRASIHRGRHPWTRALKYSVRCTLLSWRRSICV
jgi:hypothetical protein